MQRSRARGLASLLLGVAWLSAFASQAERAESAEAVEAPAWRGCLLSQVPEGACPGSWGNSTIPCNPDRFLDPDRFDYVPDEAPEGFPLERPLRIQWHVMLREDGTGDVADADITDFLAHANAAYEPAGFRLETAGIHRHRRGEIARCPMVVDERVLSDPHFDMCGEPSASDVSIDSDRYLNVYVLDLEGPTAFATGPCIYPPGDSRDGAFVNRAVFSGADRAVFIHELGHYFGLLHPFQNWRWADASPEARCEDLDNDFVKDTPPQRAGLAWPELDCENPPTSCTGSSSPDSVSNFMQYGRCVRLGESGFTPGQIRRMQWTLVEMRHGLMESP